MYTNKKYKYTFNKMSENKYEQNGKNAFIFSEIDLI